MNVICGLFGCSAGWRRQEASRLPRKAGDVKPSISRHVREVEERLGVKLCERGPSGFRLTAEGIVALDLASAALQALSRIRPEIDAVHGVLSGRLAIGLGEHTLTHPGCRLPEALEAMRDRAPNVEPQIYVMTFPELELALRDGRVDLIIRGNYRGIATSPTCRSTRKFTAYSSRTGSRMRR